MKRFMASALLGSVLCLSGCSSSDSDEGAQGDIECEGELYCPEEMWLCRPGMDKNFCREQQTATVIEADASVHEETLPKAARPAFDCFYVYPTVALTGEPGNVKDFSNLDDILVPLRAQAVPFSELCEVYAPFYHQTTLATFGAPDRETYQARAFADVEAAFDLYMRHFNRGRDFLLLGHSQGSHMLIRLIKKLFDGPAEQRSRLIAALPIGTVNEILVPPGATRGGTFENIPLCSSPDERGCIVTFDSLDVAGVGPVLGAPTADAACTNPVTHGTGLTRLKSSYFPTKRFAGQFSPENNPDYETTFTNLPDLFSGQCAFDSLGRMGFRISYTPESGDTRANPFDFSAQLMHILDYSFSLRDLIDLVALKAEQ